MMDVVLLRRSRRRGTAIPATVSLVVTTGATGAHDARHGTIPLLEPTGKSTGFHVILRDELEAERRDVFFRHAFVLAEVHGFEGGVELGCGCQAGARNRIVVYVDVLERAIYLAPVLVHRETGTFQRDVMLVPLVAEHLGLALLHVPLVGESFEVLGVSAEGGGFLCEGVGEDGGNACVGGVV